MSAATRRVKKQDVLREVPLADIQGQHIGVREEAGIEDEDHDDILDENAQAQN